jgi:HSP20 family protein
MRVEPMKELQNLTERMKKFAEEFPESVSFEFGRSFEPRVDVMVDSEHVYIHAELPGVSKDKIVLTYAEEALIISGEKIRRLSEANVELVRDERSFGAFERKVALPVKIDRESISATMTDGVLEITMSKASESIPREIKISIG